MNERIRELAEQAGITTNLDTDFFEKDPNKWVDHFAEKFAELIVRNCIDEMVEQMWHHGIDESNNPSFYKAIEKTIEEFGIKE